MQIRLNQGRVFMGRLEYGKDLLQALSDFCKQNNITLGIFSVIGAVKGAKLGYYKQEEKKYVTCRSLATTLEIAACSGNISLKDNQAMVHAHVVFADHDGNTYGGHLMPGAAIFAAEYYVQELTGTKLLRKKDEITGLPLWG